MSDSVGDYLGMSIGQWRQALQSGDAIEKRLAAHALAEIGPAAKEALPELLDALQDAQAFVRVWAAAALARIEPTRAEAFQILLSDLSDEKPFVRSLAAWHLGRLCALLPCADEVAARLQALAGDDNPSVRAEAGLALKRLEGKGAPPPELQALARGV